MRGNINYFGQQAAKLGLVADELAHDFLALSEIFCKNQRPRLML